MWLKWFYRFVFLRHEVAPGTFWGRVRFILWVCGLEACIYWRFREACCGSWQGRRWKEHVPTKRSCDWAMNCVIEMRRALLCKYRGLCSTVLMFMIQIKPSRTSEYIFSVKRICGSYSVTKHSRFQNSHPDRGSLCFESLSPSKCCVVLCNGTWPSLAPS